VTASATPAASPSIEAIAYDSPVAMVLIEELQREYVVRYGGRDDTPVDPAQFVAPDGAFLVMRVDGEPAGCAGLRRHDDRRVEVKRMFVRPTFRGRGLSRWLLARVEDQARTLGYTRALMETGLKQPEAMHLYETSGYEPIPGFGHYAREPENRCHAKDL
jgi:GNAT superfamily N-acetyltransferase